MPSRGQHNRTSQQAHIHRALYLETNDQNSFKLCQTSWTDLLDDFTKSNRRWSYRIAGTPGPRLFAHSCLCLAATHGGDSQYKYNVQRLSLFFSILFYLFLSVFLISCLFFVVVGALFALTVGTWNDMQSDRQSWVIIFKVNTFTFNLSIRVQRSWGGHNSSCFVFTVLFFLLQTTRSFLFLFFSSSFWLLLLLLVFVLFGVHAYTTKSNIQTGICGAMVHHELMGIACNARVFWSIATDNDCHTV